MGGSTIFQAIWSGYNNAAQTALTSTIGAMIPVVAAAMGGILSLAVLIAGKNLMFGELRLGRRGDARRSRTGGLGAAGRRNLQHLRDDVLDPNAAAATRRGGATGSATASGAAAFDTMVDTLTKIGVQAQAQMIGLQYLGYQVAEWLVEAMAKVFVAMAFLVWMLTSLEVMFFLPAIVLLLPAWLFDRTRAWGERATGFILGLILTGTLTLIVAQVFIDQEKTLMNQFAANVASPPGSANFSTNSGASSFSALLGGAGVTSPITGQPLGGGASLNAAGAVETMISMLITLVAGFLVLGTTSVVALLVVASGGFSAGDIVSAVSNTTKGCRRGCTGRPQAGRGETMSRQYYVSVSLRGRVIVAAFFGLCVYETAIGARLGTDGRVPDPRRAGVLRGKPPLAPQAGSRVLALIRLTLTLLLLAACTTPAPSCKVGSLVPMNAGQWTPLPVDLQR